MNDNSSLRKIMVEEVIKEVQGPRYGANETICFDPQFEYMTGIIIPESWKSTSDSASPENEILMEVDDGMGEESSSNDTIYTSFNSEKLNPKALNKSFGISFTCDIPNPKLSICATWGRYFEDENPTKAISIDGKIKDFSKSEEKSEVWRRFSFGEIFEIEIGSSHEDETIEIINDNSKELMIVKTLKDFESDYQITDRDRDGYVKIYIRRFKNDEDDYVFSVYMVNHLNYVYNKKDLSPDIDKCLFQPSMRINCENITSNNPYVANESEKELAFLYRKKPVIASGHMCSAVWKDIDYCDKISLEQLWPDYELRLKNNKSFEDFLIPDLRTEFVPLYPIRSPDFSLVENDLISSEDLKADDLAEKSPEELYDLLISLPALYEEWIKINEGNLENLEVQDKEIARNIIENENLALKRITRGIELIKDEDLVYASFCFANKVIALQNKWSKPNDEFKWRLFQIAFFLMNLEDIFVEDSENRDVLDLLWIPTGGGKTEAYLGIMAFTIALRRLKAYLENETGAGTSIISRYTLRLLTVQQFRRTLKMITAAEYLRIDKSTGQIGWRPKFSKIQGDWIYGSTRFSTGLWVGGGVSPLHLLKKGGAMDLLQDKKNETGYSQGEPAQILKCPVCGAWLSVPELGLNDEINHLHLVINSVLNQKEMENIFYKKFDNHENISLTDISSKKHKKGFYTLSFEICGSFSREEYENEILSPIFEEGMSLASLGNYNAGYFTSLNKVSRFYGDDVGDYDFEIWCTNPDCDLNNVEWHEGYPYPDSDSPDYSDGNFHRDIYSPFEDNTRMPIPAYLIDDHVYSRCPTIIVSTADKIARLAFEPRAGSIFGNVNYFNKYLGYNRNEMFPKDSKGQPNFNVEIDSLKAPDLIIQDELHLIDGPLGSLFGLYEAIVDAIIEKQGGNPKYIASTATISNAQKQVDMLFSKELFQFPPHGLDISDNFYVREYDYKDSWNDEKSGRLYLGFYAPGKGPMTPQVRLWSRILKCPEDEKENKDLKNFWTVVGYFSSIKELGGSLALYRDDIKDRLEYLGMKNRPLNEDNKVELSSRKSSTELPIILDNLERDGNNTQPYYDALFTTSMFGTGVDVSHLSLMVMTSQPKTTGDYIQATGRIGRDKGGLVIDFFKSGRPRDLNHYEMFSSYHSRIYQNVEPVSVSPYSQGCISHGLGPAIVAFLRNSPELLVRWDDNDGKTPLENENSSNDFKELYDFLSKRLDTISEIYPNVKQNVLKYFEECEEKWRDVASILEEGKLLKMYEYSFNKPIQHVVLGDEAHGYNDKLEVVYDNAPQSLRDVEETIDFWV